jgi:hypothetical protein
MKVKELKEVLAGADDEAEVVIERQTTVAGGGLMKINPLDVFEAHGAVKQPTGKVSIFYDESRRTKS